MKQRDVPTSRLRIATDSESELVIARKPDLKTGALTLAVCVLLINLAVALYTWLGQESSSEPSIFITFVGSGILLTMVVVLIRAGIHLSVDRETRIMSIRRGFLLRRPMIVGAQPAMTFNLKNGLYQSEADYKVEKGIRTVIWNLSCPRKAGRTPRIITLDQGADIETIRDMAVKLSEATGIPLQDLSENIEE